MYYMAVLLLYCCGLRCTTNFCDRLRCGLGRLYWGLVLLHPSLRCVQSRLNADYIQPCCIIPEESALRYVGASI
jgi:hypothetical protein